MNTCHHFATVLTQLLGSDTAVRLTVSGSMPLSVEHIGEIRRRPPSGVSLPLSRTDPAT